MKDWNQHATVRTGPRRLVTLDSTNGALWFSPALAPVVAHPTVQQRGPQAVRDALAQALFAYLDFTAHLEHRVVNEVAADLALGEVPIMLPREKRLEAHQLYCDEGYHALAAADLARQVELSSGVEPAGTGAPSFLGELDQALAPLDERDRALGRLMFTVVCETMISSTLRWVPRDGAVAPAVRDVIHDHALDEARHHVFFASVLDRLWPQLGDESRERLGTLVPAFILLFVRPDRARWTQILATLDIVGADASRALDETFPDDRLARDAGRTAHATIRLFDRVGSFEVPAIRDAFSRSGLPVGATAAVSRGASR